MSILPAHIYVHHMRAWSQGKLEKSTRSSRTKEIYGCEQSPVSAGNQTGSSEAQLILFFPEPPLQSVPIADDSSLAPEWLGNLLRYHTAEKG